MITHRYEMAAPISLTAGVGAFMPAFSQAVQTLSGLVGLASGLIFLYSWIKSRK